jgi:hypothetical protein
MKFIQITQKFSVRSSWWTQSVSNKLIGRLILLKEEFLFILRMENHKYTLRALTTEFFNVKAGGYLSFRCALKS